MQNLMKLLTQKATSINNNKYIFPFSFDSEFYNNKLF